MKVFGITMMFREKDLWMFLPLRPRTHYQARVIVGAKSLEEAHRKPKRLKVFGYDYGSSSWLRDYSSETGNEKEIALSSDGSIWVRLLDESTEYVKWVERKE